MGRRQILNLALVATLAVGCQMGRKTTVQIGPEAFFAPPQAIAERREPVVHPVAMMRAEAMPQPAIFPAQQELVVAPPPTPTTLPTPSASSSGYQTAGAVITEVSGVPIFADRILSDLAPMLASEAKQLDPRSFRMLAGREIEKRLGAMIESELTLGAALQNLTPEDKSIVERMTMFYRTQLITVAGGSEAVARQRAREEGIDFDEVVHDYYRRRMVQMFYQRKIIPQVSASAQDMRQYYDSHVKTEFTEAGRAQFRVIKINPSRVDGATDEERRSAAIEQMRQLHELASKMTNEEFAKAAGEHNHDPALLKSSGRVGAADGWVERGAFFVTEVEEAVWKLQPGQVTDPIEVGGAFYIARLEQRTPGKVRPFEDEEVQRIVRNAIEQPQIAVREGTFTRKLRIETLNSLPSSIDTVLEMAMQKYPEWSARPTASSN